VLCTDKTDTLTEGGVWLDSALDVKGNASEKVQLYAFLNEHFQTTYQIHRMKPSSTLNYAAS
jgi:hypothetical protein